MKSVSQILSLVALMFCFCTTVCASPTAKLTAKIVDENGASIQGASVCLSFSAAKHGDGGGLKSFGKEGLSDKNGLFLDSSETLPLVGVVVDKDGHYRSIQKYEFKSSSLLLNRWEPWNPTIEVVLKKKRNPVPMYMGGMDWAAIPKLDEPVGFDLERGDWVVPYGKGTVNDFVFVFKSTQRAWTDYESSYTLRFANEKDGIQEFVFDRNNQSLYRWPFEAPETGYLPTLQKYRNDSPATNLQTNERKEINYIFRVRTKTDKNGNIVAATYGKITGEIRIVPGKIQFSYSFNPDGTRNLEEDPEKNLFKKK